MSLTTALEAVLSQLVRLEHPLVSLLQPGLSREAIDEIVKPFPFMLPEDLYELYMWRNGTAAGSYAYTSLFPHPAGYFAPLDQALESSLNLSQYLNSDGPMETWGHLEFELSAYYFDLFSDPGDTDFLVPCSTLPLEKPPILIWSPELGTPRIIYSDLESMIWTIAACYEGGAYYLKNDFDNEPLYPATNHVHERQIAQQLNLTVRYWHEEPMTEMK